ncbi:centrosome-associated protein CEP250-like isoform X2 [Sycon ciliatum]|uniref:centrosome-associated protein CEP250-like isoform X2 n=1 Tax=Sycon ciliatum TaxID=27933 RepID=UPI0031F6BBCE
MLDQMASGEIASVPRVEVQNIKVEEIDDDSHTDTLLLEPTNKYILDKVLEEHTHEADVKELGNFIIDECIASESSSPGDCADSSSLPEQTVNTPGNPEQDVETISNETSQHGRVDLPAFGSSLFQTVYRDSENRLVQMRAEKQELKKQLEDTTGQLKAVTARQEGRDKETRRQNDEQVQAVEADKEKIASQCHYLERQLEATKEELRTTQLSNYGLEKKLSDQAFQVQQDQAANNTILSRVAALEQKASNMVKQAQDASMLLDQLKDNMQIVEKRQEQLMLVNEQERTRLGKAQQDLANATQDMAALRSEFAVASSDTAASALEMGKLTGQYQKEMALRKQLVEQLEQSQLESKRLIGLLSESHTLVERHQEKADKERSSSEEALDKLHTSNASIAELEHLQAVAQEHEQELKDKILDLESAKLELQSRLDSEHNRCDDLQQTCSNLESSCRMAKEMEKRLMDQIKALEEHTETLKEECARHVTASDQSKLLQLSDESPTHRLVHTDQSASTNVDSTDHNMATTAIPSKPSHQPSNTTDIVESVLEMPGNATNTSVLCGSNDAAQEVQAEELPMDTGLIATSLKMANEELDMANLQHTAPSESGCTLRSGFNDAHAEAAANSSPVQQLITREIFMASPSLSESSQEVEGPRICKPKQCGSVQSPLQTCTRQQQREAVGAPLDALAQRAPCQVGSQQEQQQQQQKKQEQHHQQQEEEQQVPITCTKHDDAAQHIPSKATVEMTASSMMMLGSKESLSNVDMSANTGLGEKQHRDKSHSYTATESSNASETVADGRSTRTESTGNPKADIDHTRCAGNAVEDDNPDKQLLSTVDNQADPIKPAQKRLCIGVAHIGSKEWGKGTSCSAAAEEDRRQPGFTRDKLLNEAVSAPVLLAPQPIGSISPAPSQSAPIPPTPPTSPSPENVTELCGQTHLASISDATPQPAAVDGTSSLLASFSDDSQDEQVDNASVSHCLKLLMSRAPAKRLLKRKHNTAAEHEP